MATSRTHRPGSRVLLGLALVLPLAAGCSSAHGRPTAASTDLPAAAAAPAPVPSARLTLARDASPLTGLPGGAGRQVLAVKVDNTVDGRPQSGVEDADVVYLEEVEGGLTRLCAVFSSRLPARVGPVRSVRETDLELLAPYGRPAFAFSGGNKGLLRLVRRASPANASFDAVTRAYARSDARPMPYNLYARPAALLAARRGSSLVHDVGFAFGPLPATAHPSAGGSVRFSHAAVGWTWDAAGRHWALSMDGRPDLTAAGRRLSADDVVVQFVRVTGSRFHDVNGVQSPIAHTAGSGEAMVFRDGQVMHASWARSAVGPTRYRLGDGTPALLQPGRTWVLLVPVGTAVSGG